MSRNGELRVALVHDWVTGLRGGERVQMTNVDGGVEGYEWSPDGKQLVLTIRDQEPDAGTLPWVIDSLKFKEDYVGYLNRHRYHVHVIDLATRDTRQLTHGDFDDSEPAWSPDSRKIVFVSNRTDSPDRNRKVA